MVETTKGQAGSQISGVEGGLLRGLISAKATPVIAATIALIAVSAVIAPGSVQGASFLTMLPYAGILAIAALGQTLVVMLKGIDLSVPGIITISALVGSKLSNDGMPILAVLIIVALVATLAGLVNGIMVTVFNVTPLIVTLSTNTILLGAGLAFSGGTPTRSSAEIAEFSLTKTLGLSNTAWLALVFIMVMIAVVVKSVWGRKVTAVGSSVSASRASGVPTQLVIVSGYVAAALCYAAAGVLLAGFVASPNLALGNDYLMPTIAAVVLGGTQLTGGRGSVLGTAVGAIFLTQLGQLVVAIGAPPSIQKLVEAAIILFAVGLGARKADSWTKPIGNKKKTSTVNTPIIAAP